MIDSTTRRPRRGFLSVVVLISLVVLMMIAVSLLRTGLARRDEARAQERRLQADWLAEAGIRRAIARLDGDPGYTGETWPIDAPALDSADGASVQIDVERDRQGSSQRTIRVRADYPLDAVRRVRRSRQITIRAPDGGVK